LIHFYKRMFNKYVFSLGAIIIMSKAAATGKEVSSVESIATDTPVEESMGGDTNSPVDDLGWTLEGNCLVLKMSAELNISADLPTIPTTTIASVPVSAIVANTSSCSVIMSSAYPSQVISLNWFDKESSTGRHLARNISLQFSLDNTTSNTLYGISRVTAMYEILVNEVGKDKDDNNNSTVGMSKFVKMTTGRLNTLEYPSTLHRSLVCQQPKSLQVTSELLSHDGVVVRNLLPSSVNIKNIQFDGFRPEKFPEDEFQVSTSCIQVKPTDLVPVLVGGGLAGVVLFIVVGYLVGRKKVILKGRGYSNV